GLVGSIASEVVTDEVVLDGPILGNELVGYFGNKVFVDDAVNQDSLDIVCRVTHVKQTPGGASIGQESLWPQHKTWMHYAGYAGDQWSPVAEN
ncbi:hypothetical protein, partial [Alkalibacillus haloalkaliphilus]|uniref:hypothetical protein n=1 Tax=Alkalibacillus haloalkaliphilus TaxID=94136 RepID=UPI0029369B20